MRCNVEYARPSSAVQGWHHYRCTRRGCPAHADSPYQLERVIFPNDCPGQPHDHEWREWLAIFREAAGLTSAERLCQFIRWRAKGSPLDQLPSGIPHPGLIPLPAPDDGPGTELEIIFHNAGASSDLCGGTCQQWRDQMNRWGIDGCRHHRATIIKHITTAIYKTWVTDQLKIGWSISRQPWFNARDPIGSIVDEAIRRAESSLPPAAQL